MKVTVRELKNQLSEYLKRAQRGEDVIVTSHGNAVVRLVPVSESSAPEPNAAELLKRLKSISGVHIAKGGKPKGAARPPRIKRGEKTLAQIVAEQRR